MENNRHWQAYFFLCVLCWENLYVSYPIFEDILKASLSMAMRHNAISGAEAPRLMQDFKQRGNHHEDPVSRASVDFIADFDLAMSAPEQALVNNLAEQFEELALLNDLITESPARE